MKPIEIESSQTGGSAAAQTTPMVTTGPLVAQAVPQPALAPSEQKQLDDCEAIIASGWNHFVRVGQALAVIRDQKLYRQFFRTFEGYCAQKWQYSRIYAHRLIGAAQTMRILLPIGNIPAPENEAQVRPLIGLSPQDAKAAWNDAVKAADGGPVTAKLVRAAVRSFAGPRAESPTERTSSSGLKTLRPHQIRDLKALLKEADTFVNEASRALRTSASSGEIWAIHDKALRSLSEALELLDSVHSSTE